MLSREVESYASIQNIPITSLQQNLLRTFVCWFNTKRLRLRCPVIQLYSGYHGEDRQLWQLVKSTYPEMFKTIDYPGEPVADLIFNHEPMNAENGSERLANSLSSGNFYIVSFDGMSRAVDYEYFMIEYKLENSIEGFLLC